MLAVYSREVECFMRWLIDIFQQFRGLRQFENLSSEDRDIVFYSEFSGQWTYFKPYIEELTQVYHRKICYLTSSRTDPILSTLNKMIVPIYIG